MTAIALTDHNVLHGAIEFIKRVKENIKPIIGMKGVVINDQVNELIILAKNNHGISITQNLQSNSNE